MKSNKKIIWAVIISFSFGFFVAITNLTVVAIKKSNTVPEISASEQYRLGYSYASGFAESCAAKEIIWGHPSDLDCVDFFLGRQKIISDYYDDHQ